MKSEGIKAGSACFSRYVSPKERVVLRSESEQCMAGWCEPSFMLFSPF